MVECVQNHCPHVMVIDEIGREREVFVPCPSPCPARAASPAPTLAPASALTPPLQAQALRFPSLYPCPSPSVVPDPLSLALSRFMPSLPDHRLCPCPLHVCAPLPTTYAPDPDAGHGSAPQVFAAATVKQRGVRMVASAHGSFHKLMKNRQLKGLLGGFEQVILPKGIPATKRVADPTFDCIIEVCRVRWRQGRGVYMGRRGPALSPRHFGIRLCLQMAFELVVLQRHHMSARGNTSERCFGGFGGHM